MHKLQYINNVLKVKIRKIAKERGLSISKYISTLLQQELNDKWESYTKELSGSWSDFASIEAIRDYSVKDVVREKF